MPCVTSQLATPSTACGGEESHARTLGWTMRVLNSKDVHRTRKVEHFRFTPGSHRRKRISFDVSLPVGSHSHSDTNSEGDEGTQIPIPKAMKIPAAKAAVQTKSGTNSIMCRCEANLKFEENQTSDTKLKAKRLQCIRNRSNEPPADSCVHSPHDEHRVSAGVFDDQIVGIWCFVLCGS